MADKVTISTKGSIKKRKGITLDYHQNDRCAPGEIYFTKPMDPTKWEGRSINCYHPWIAKTLARVLNWTWRLFGR